MLAGKDGRRRRVAGRRHVRRGRRLGGLDDLLHDGRGLDDLLDGHRLGDDGLGDGDGARADAHPHGLVALHRLHDLDGLVAGHRLDDVHRRSLAAEQVARGVGGGGGRGQGDGGGGKGLVDHGW